MKEILEPSERACCDEICDRRDQAAQQLWPATLPSGRPNAEWCDEWVIEAPDGSECYRHAFLISVDDARYPANQSLRLDSLPFENQNWFDIQQGTVRISFSEASNPEAVGSAREIDLIFRNTSSEFSVMIDEVRLAGPAVTPEPNMIVLLCLGGLFGACFRRRRAEIAEVRSPRPGRI